MRTRIFLTLVATFALSIANAQQASSTGQAGIAPSNQAPAQQQVPQQSTQQNQNQNQQQTQQQLSPQQQVQLQAQNLGVPIVMALTPDEIHGQWSSKCLTAIPTYYPRPFPSATVSPNINPAGPFA